MASIEVVATAQGYYGCQREKGDKFFIKSKEDLGLWMKPTDSDGPDDTEDTAKLVEHIAQTNDVEQLQNLTKDTRQKVKREAEKRLKQLQSGDSKEPTKTDGDSSNDDKQPTAAELKTQIAESDDIEKLQELAKDERSTVKTAAEKRLKELAG